MNESIQTVLLEGKGGMNQNKKEGDNVSGWMPLLHPEIIIQIFTDSAESKEGTLWEAFLPVPCPSGNYLGRHLSRDSCQILSLLSAALLPYPHTACWMYWSYETVGSQPTAMLRHTNKTWHCFYVCWWLDVYAVVMLLSSSNCSLLLVLYDSAAGRRRLTEQQAEENSNCGVVFGGSDEVVLLWSWPFMLPFSRLLYCPYRQK